MKGKIDARIWERASKEEKKKAYGYAWMILFSILFIWGVLFFLLYENGVFDIEFDELDVSLRLTYLGLFLVGFLSFTGELVGIILEMKNIRGKYGIEVILLLPAVALTSGLSLFVGIVIY